MLDVETNKAGGSFFLSPESTITSQGSKIFRPPPRTLLLTSSTSSSRSHYNRGIANDGCRKRVRHSYDSDPTANTPIGTPLREWAEVPSMTSSACFSSAPSPAPLANTKYQLAGGLDTPGTMIEAKYEDGDKGREGSHDEQDLRPSRLRVTVQGSQDSYFPETPRTLVGNSPLDRKRKHPSDRPGWTRSIVNTVGGIAWKGINFCFTTAFGGFHAGGGAGYDMSATTPTVVGNNDWAKLDEKNDVFHQSYERQEYHHATPIPGQFPEDDPFDESIAKVDAVKGECSSHMGEPWVLVPEEGDAGSFTHRQMQRGPKPTGVEHRRTGSQASIAGMRSKSAAHPQSRQMSIGGSPSVQPTRNASYASPRSLRKASHAESTHRRSPSPTKSRVSLATASPRRATAPKPHTSGTLTPTSPHVQKFEKSMRAKERKEDEDIKRLNKQLRDMIREGREALGTRIEVEDNEDSEDDEEE
ncbi:hypothetical protein UCRPC4_g02603 [Phaeomoniella chlamydospora]|uniref:Uncharacterized protein n=1 Tax=Phaeomoniella chlamydospora TaxID=158046 RepID=A0A0G2EMZ0_PHACM|nr:hypothetical protein UCRPC4_g02603 [Phaeomoniella chlamydospora]